MAKQSSRRIERRPISEAVQAAQIQKEFEKYVELHPLPEGPFMMAILKESRIAPYFKQVSEALAAAIDRKDALLVVLDTFEDVQIFKREDMRQAGWLWVGAPRGEELDGDYWHEIAEITEAINDRLVGEKIFLPINVTAAMLSAYQLQLRSQLKKMQATWQRAVIVHPDLESWAVPVPRASEWQRFWLRLQLWLKGPKKSKKTVIRKTERYNEYDPAKGE